MGRYLTGMVSVSRFAEGGSFLIVRKHDLPSCVHEGQGEPIQANAGDFLLQAFRRKAQGNKWSESHAVDTPVVIPANEFEDSVWPAILPLLLKWREPASFRCAYREPPWSLQVGAANVEAFNDKSIEVTGMRSTGKRELRSTGVCVRIERETPSRNLVAAILRVMAHTPDTV